MTAAAGGGMKTSEMRREMVNPGTVEWAGIGWTDSSWELARGLEVVEDLPADAWPAEFPASLKPLAMAPQKN